MAEFEKVSVTLPKDLVESARARAGVGGLSAYIAEGLRLAEHMAALVAVTAIGLERPVTILTSDADDLRALTEGYPLVKVVTI